MSKVELTPAQRAAARRIAHALFIDDFKKATKAAARQVVTGAMVKEVIDYQVIKARIGNDMFIDQMGKAIRRGDFDEFT